MVVGGVPLGSGLIDDVPEGHWADEEVGWAVSNGVMEGVGGGRFDLEGVVPRWQMVSALFRAFGLAGGKGEAGGVPLGSDSFVDVPVGHVADGEIGWAVASGITRGVGGGRFDPDGSVTRAQIVTFLYRLSGLLDGPVGGGGLGSDVFVDVPAGHWADEEVGWAVDVGVTVGVGDNRFDLDRVVSRAQIVTFLFRVVGLVEESRVDVRVEAGNFTAVTAGHRHSCGLRTDGTIVCWGRNRDGEADPPDGNFTAVSAGSHHSCGLRADGTIVCWGWNRFGETEPPNGIFTAVDSGLYHSCGLRADGTIVCWGWNRYGQVDPPDGNFTAVSTPVIAGIRVGCGPMAPSSAGAATATARLTHPTGISRRSPPEAGIRVGCGPMAPSSAGASTQTARADPPDGIFTAVSPGGAHSCGLRADGTIVCWGSNSLRTGDYVGQG